MLKLSLPPAPPLNNAYANRRDGGGRYKTRRHQDWLKQADAEYTLQRLDRLSKITVPFACRMRFPRMRSDLDGRAKLILDWLVSRELVIDDRYCRKLILESDDDPNLKMVRIEVVPYAARGSTGLQPGDRGVPLEARSGKQKGR